MQLSDGLKYGAGLAAAALVVGYLHGQVSPGPEAAIGHFRMGDAGGPLGVWSEVWLPDTTVRAFGVDPVAWRAAHISPLSDGGQSEGITALGFVCGTEVDGGLDPGSRSVPGMEIIYDQTNTSECDAGSAGLEAWFVGFPGAPWACACSSGAACLWTHPVSGPLSAPATDAAPLGQSLDRGTWAGPGCVGMPCQFFSGRPSWPLACPLAGP
jgi:hypothetical protein